MQPFNFKVVRSDDKDSQVPVSVAGQTMVDVQQLLTDIGALMIRRELRLQNDMPDDLMHRFCLSMDLSKGRDVGAVTEGEDTLMLDALNQLFRELDLANMPEARDAPSNHLEALSRRKVSKDLLALSEHLEGYDLFYGSGPDLRKFRLNRRDKIEGEAEDRSRSFPGALIGIISQDPVKKHRWVISNGGSEVPISFAGNIAPSDVPLFAKSGPLIASGMVMVDDDGRVSELKSVIGCYSFPNVKFHRVISAERDIPLLNPLEATPGYDQHKGLWTLSNDDLGISVSKPSWDACVMSFHEYFVFLWETYAESDDEFEGEEQEIRELLLSMIPVTAE